MYSRNETTRFVEKQRYETNREIDVETTPSILRQHIVSQAEKFLVHITQ